MFLNFRQVYKRILSNPIKWAKLKQSADFKIVSSAKVYWILVIDGNIYV